MENYRIGAEGKAWCGMGQQSRSRTRLWPEGRFGTILKNKNTKNKTKITPKKSKIKTPKKKSQKSPHLKTPRESCVTSTQEWDRIY